jgi:hypothetical protein
MVAEFFTLGGITFDGFIRGNVTLSATATDANLTTGIFAGWFVNDPGAPSGNPNWLDFMPISPALDASSGAFASSWSTLGSYDDGIYVIAAAVIDAAGNSNASSPTKILYLDNGVPWTANPMVYLPMGIARGPVYVTASSQANDGFLKEVEHRFVLQGGDPENPVEVGTKRQEFTFAAQSKARFAVSVYVMDTSSWGNGTYEGYSYATDWAGNTFRAGPSAFFDVGIKRLESGSLSATFTSVGPGQFEMSVTGRIVDANGNGVPGENLHLLSYRGVRACTDASCSSTLLSYSTFNDNTPITDGSGYFNYTVPTTQLLYENPVPSVHTTDRYICYVRDSSDKNYGFIIGDLDDPPQQLNPFQNASYYLQGNLISNLSTSLDPFGTDYRITVSGNLIRPDGQPAEYVPLRIRTWSYDPFAPGYVYNPSSSTYFEITTGAYGEFSYQVPTVFPDGSYYFYVRFYDDTYSYIGYLYQASPTPTGPLSFNPF